ncbi:NADPH-dependent FMN reductase [Kitasatospora azatica]|uniref:NADPH-dependent FMN reductase n=1 Tax=Kitasatospora azatica TaxID=58347 RepID=UPI00055C12BF|nr:NADPH-dependent FMN reductase [Kitasatospora azatica]
MAIVLALSGSPSPASRTARLAELAAADLRARGHRVHTLALRDLPAGPLLAAQGTDPAIARAVRLVAEADALVVATPIYQAAYSGLLKVFLDLLPRHALDGKTVLPLATGGSAAHVLALDYALRPVLTTLGAQVAQGRYVLDHELGATADGPALPAADSADALADAVARFASALPRLRGGTWNPALLSSA